MREPISLPDEECRRLVRSEMTAVRMLLAGLSTVGYANEDLGEVLKMIPNGKRRLKLGLGQLNAVMSDMIGVISKPQCRQIWGTMKDYEMRLVPKLAPLSKNVLMTFDEGKDLMDMARERCHSCIEDGESCRKCRLYQILEATTPLEEWTDSMICPYSLATWE